MERKTQIRSRTSGPKEQLSDELPGFLFCLIYPRIGTGEASNLKTPMGVDKKNTKQKIKTTLKQRLFCLPKGLGKGHPRKIGNFQTVNILFQMNATEKNCVPTPTHAWKDQVGSLDLHLHKAIMKHPNTQTHWSGVREGQAGSQDFHLYQLVTNSSQPQHHSVGGDHMGSLDFNDHLTVMRHFPSSLE